MASSDKRVQASAIVTLKLEITVADTWGADCALDQIYRQAAESAINVIQRAMPRGYNQYNTGQVRLLDKPEVVTVLVRR